MRMITVRFVRFLGMAMVVLALAACGQKGDLYQPEASSLIEISDQRPV